MSFVTRAVTVSLLVAPAFSQSWTASHPVQPGWTIRYAASVAKQAGQNQIFLFGGTPGLSSSDLVWRYHRTNGWFVMGNMPGPRHDEAATTVEIGGQDYIHLLGGGVGGTAVTTTNWRYDVNADTWDSTSFAPMPVAKANMEAVTAPNGLIYVFGGNDADGGVTYSSMHIYDPIANTWTAGPAMPRARRNFAALKDCDGYIYLYGGNTGATTHAEIDCYDTVSNVWINTNPHTGGAFPDMITPRSNVAGALGRNGRHYITGGNVLSPVAVPTVESFSPYTNTWNVEASMLESRNQHRVVGLGSRIWVMGGYRKIWPTTNKLESFGGLGYYGPCGDDVAPLPPPVISHEYATAVALDFVTTFTGGVINPGLDHYFSVRVRDDVHTFVDVDTGAQQNHLRLSLYDEQQNLLKQVPASEGILLNGAGLPSQIVYLVLSSASSAGASEYDLYLTSTNDAGPIGEVYCHAATPNSTGDPAGIRAIGLASAAANAIELQVTSLPPQSFGYFLVAPEAGSIANPGGSQGTLCLTGTQIGRYAGNILNSGPNGEVALQIDLTSIPGNPPSIGVAGDRWYFTFWNRDADPAGGATSNFSDGVCVELR
ncbi:N-acetylneuraminate epimerase [Planctomycetes bacterium Poly30]|uniref:N-acetylneuraminate epimerase n=1 Tax=Saltatorellus ferox TaxID=2528018 RepID=A0A518EWF8_9BACT|nr:N-acetylneuraminate epimerase [Planctomycetes bacterium Poly30]